MFRIKICGITNASDAHLAARAGADAIGLNFFPKSRRFVELAAARAATEALPNTVLKIGVFVNHSAADIQRIATEVGLDGIQLHGDEPASILSELPSDKLVIRAFRCGADGLAPFRPYLDACRTAGRTPDAVLIDANAGSEFGGTGQRADWPRIAAERETLHGLSLILAGGLEPANLATAIAVVRPDGVDVASGVEFAPGKKDGQLVLEFTAAARHAFRAIERDISPGR